MKTGVVIDSACDLPQSYLQNHDIHIMPINLHFGSEVFQDIRDPEATQTFYRKYIAEKTLDAETAPSSVQQIKALFLDLLLNYDRVLVITIAKTRSLIFNNAVEAYLAVLRQYREDHQQYREKRQNAGMIGSFYLSVLDSNALFTGEGVLVHEAVRLLKEEDIPFSAIRGIIEPLSQRVYTYLVPSDLFYIRHRARRKGEKSVSFLGYHIGSLLDIKPILGFNRGESQVIAKERGFDRALAGLLERARAAVDQGLGTDVIVASYAGDPRLIQQKQMFVDFERHVRDRGIEVLMSVMSTTAGINVGPGAFSLAYAIR